MEEKVLKCSIKGCGRDACENDRCILHCNKTEKNGWYEIINGKKEWYNVLVIEFWQEFYNYIEIQKKINDKFSVINIDDIIFPPVQDRLGSEILENTKSEIKKDRLLFYNCRFLDRFIIGLMDLKILNFQKCYFDGYTTILLPGIKQVIITESTINNVFNMYGLRQQNDHLLSFDHLETDTNLVQLSRVLLEQKSEFNIDNILTKDFNLFNINNLSRSVRFVDFTVTNVFSCRNITFTNTKFINCDFIQVNRFTLKEMFLENVQLNNILWGKIINERYDCNRDIIRQMKQSYDSQGNYIQANKFYSLEMEKYSEEIKLSKNYMDEVIFFMGKNLSNFSQNWILPIFWFFFLSTALFNFIELKKIGYGWSLLSVILILFLFSEKILKRISIVGSILFIGVSFLYHYYEGACGNYLEFTFSPTLNFSVSKDLHYMICFISFKLISILISYHLVTALRFHTRRK